MTGRREKTSENNQGREENISVGSGKRWDLKQPFTLVVQQQVRQSKSMEQW
jgi:hypothetical protein